MGNNIAYGAVGFYFVFFLTDVVEVDELKNGVRREGVIYGATMLLYKISSAIIVALVSAAMGWFGYIESTGNSVVT